MCRSAGPARPVPFTLEFRVHDSAYGTGLARWIVPVGHHHLAVTPLTLVDKLSSDLAHSRVGLCLRRQAGHHTLHIQVLDDQGLELSDKARRHLALGVPPESRDASLEPVHAPLGFPPAPAAGPSARLRSLPAP